MSIGKSLVSVLYFRNTYLFVQLVLKFKSHTFSSICSISEILLLNINLLYSRHFDSLRCGDVIGPVPVGLFLPLIPVGVFWDEDEGVGHGGQEGANERTKPEHDLREIICTH